MGLLPIIVGDICSRTFSYPSVMVLFFCLRFGRKKVVVIGLVVAAIANLLVTVIPDDRENTGEVTSLKWFMRKIISCRIFRLSSLCKRCLNS